MELITTKGELLTWLADKVKTTGKSVNFRSPIVEQFDGIVAALVANGFWVYGGNSEDFLYETFSSPDESQTTETLLNAVAQIAQLSEGARLEIGLDSLLMVDSIAVEILAWCLFFPRIRYKADPAQRKRLAEWLTTNPLPADGSRGMTSTPKFEEKFGIKVSVVLCRG